MGDSILFGAEVKLDTTGSTPLLSHVECPILTVGPEFENDTKAERIRHSLGYNDNLEVASIQDPSSFVQRDEQCVPSRCGSKHEFSFFDGQSPAAYCGGSNSERKRGKHQY
jgi:hypothetical protein